MEEFAAVSGIFRPVVSKMTGLRSGFSQRPIGRKCESEVGPVVNRGSPDMPVTPSGGIGARRGQRSRKRGPRSPGKAWRPSV